MPGRRAVHGLKGRKALHTLSSLEGLTPLTIVIM